jgi:hypothetical protein
MVPCQGVILGGLLNMFIISDDSSLIDLATSIANATATTLVYPNGVLHEPCEPDCGGDGPQFKVWQDQ